MGKSDMSSEAWLASGTLCFGPGLLLPEPERLIGSDPLKLVSRGRPCSESRIFHQVPAPSQARQIPHRGLH